VRIFGIGVYQTDDRRMPHSIVPANHCYIREGRTHDCSLDEKGSTEVPSPWLCREVGLRWHGEEGIYRDEHGGASAIDPSVSEAGLGALLTGRWATLDLTARRGVSLIWTILGERIVVAGSHPPQVRGDPVQASSVGCWNGHAGLEYVLNPLPYKPDSLP